MSSPKCNHEVTKTRRTREEYSWLRVFVAKNVATTKNAQIRVLHHGWSAVHSLCDFEAVDEFLDVCQRNGIAGFHAADDFDAIAGAIPDLQLTGGKSIAFDDEHAVHAVPILQRLVRKGDHLVDLGGLDVHAREGPRFQHDVAVRHAGFER